MATIPIHTISSAPEESRPLLEAAQALMGMIPNLAAGMAESPTLLRGFFTLREIYSQGTLTAQEIQLLSMVNARENGCDWCVAFHSRAALSAGVQPKVVEAVRSGGLPEEPRAKALCRLSQELIRYRGRATAEALAELTAAGAGPAQALEVVLGVGFSTLANYAGHLIGPPLDQALAPHQWSPGATRMQLASIPAVA